MAKYFEGKKKLPFARERIILDNLTVRRIETLLAKHGGAVSLCVRFKNFEQDCLGYIFNIKEIDTHFEISDITRKKLHTVESLDALLAMIQHASGAKYDQSWQEVFQHLRNQITSDR